MEPDEAGTSARRREHQAGEAVACATLKQLLGNRKAQPAKSLKQAPATSKAKICWEPAARVCVDRKLTGARNFGT
jgi:hypothetical protein